MKKLTSLAAAAIICAVLSSCKKSDVAPVKEGSDNQLKSNDLSTLPVFIKRFTSHGYPGNLYISGDTLSITDEYANYKVNKQTGNLIKMYGSTANDEGKFSGWFSFPSERDYFVKYVKRRDKTGNLINLYCYPEGVDFDPGPDVHYLGFPPHGAGVTRFVAIQKLDAQRKLSWAKLNGGYVIGDNYNPSFDVDDAGNIYTCGTGPGASLEMPTTASLGFIQKADTNGKLLWQTRLTEKFPSNIVVDRTGNSFFIADNMIIKIDTRGKLVAKKTLPGPANTTSVVVSGIAIDKKDNLYIHGYYTLKFANGTTTHHSFIQKADTNGNAGWYVNSSSAQVTQNDVNRFYIQTITVDDNGDIYAACNSRGTITLGGGQISITDGDYPYIIKLGQPNY